MDKPRNNPIKQQTKARTTRRTNPQSPPESPYAKIDVLNTLSAAISQAPRLSAALDATLVRLALAPALLRIAGRWNWWPSY